MMNMPEPLAIASFNGINNNLHQTYIDAALQSMKSAANEVRMPIEPGSSEGDIVDCQVSIDSLCHKQGYSSISEWIYKCNIHRK